MLYFLVLANWIDFYRIINLLLSKLIPFLIMIYKFIKKNIFLKSKKKYHVFFNYIMKWKYIKEYLF